MINVNFTYEGDNYNVSLVPREDYHFETVRLGDKEFTIRVSFTNNYITVYKIDEDEDPFSTADNQVYVQKIRVNKVRASKFLSWYISTFGDYCALGSKVFEILFENGSVSFSVVDLFNECGYIPAEICDQKIDGIDEYRPNDLLFYDDISKPNLSDDQKMYYYEKQTSNF